MEITAPEITTYIESMTTPENEVLHYITRQTWLKQIYPRMLSGHVQGKFLEMISRMIQPECVLEIGTFTAYATVCLSQGLKSGGTITTIEINAELEETIKEHISIAGIEHKVKCIIGDALQVIPQLSDSFDLVFIDADKEFYVEYFEAVVPKVKNGGFILADNVLWGGKVLDESSADKETAGIIRFNKYVRNYPDVETVMLPLRDGISIIRKL